MTTSARYEGKEGRIMRTDRKGRNFSSMMKIGGGGNNPPVLKVNKSLRKEVSGEFAGETGDDSKQTDCEEHRQQGGRPKP